RRDLWRQIIGTLWRDRTGFGAWSNRKLRQTSSEPDMNERDIFLQALEAPGPVQRERYLDTVCGEDLALRQRVEKLLAAHEAAGGILDRPAVPDDATGAYRPITEGPGTAIGPYKLLQQIGEGGFGVVFMA